MKAKISRVKNRFYNFSSDNLSASMAFLSEPEIIRRLGDLANVGKASIYDKAMDQEYLKSCIGGCYHRVFDGGHDIIGAWDKVKNSSSSDTLTQEVVGYFSAIWKDITTIQGLPITTFDKDSFDAFAKNISELSSGLVDKKYIVDLVSFDAMELATTELGIVAVMLAISKNDQKKISEILGSLGVFSVITANPIVGLSMLISFSYAYKYKKLEFDGSSFGVGSTLSVASLGMFYFLGLPMLIELVIVGVLTSLLRKQIVNPTKFKLFILEKVARPVSLKAKNIIASTQLINIRGISYKFSKVRFLNFKWFPVKKYSQFFS